MPTVVYTFVFSGDAPPRGAIGDDVEAEALAARAGRPQAVLVTAEVHAGESPAQRLSLSGEFHRFSQRNGCIVE